MPDARVIREFAELTVAQFKLPSGPIQIAENANLESLSGEQKRELIKLIFSRGIMRGLTSRAVSPEEAAEITGTRELTGVLLEGIAMGLAIADELSPWEARRWNENSKSLKNAHPYEMHVGLGLALSSLNRARKLVVMWEQLDPVWRWLALDGCGFHYGIFGGASTRVWNFINEFVQRRSHAENVFYQGYGRSLWFTSNGDVQQIIRRAHCLKRNDIWFGLGVAATYTSGVSQSELHALANHAGESSAHLAAGSATAAHLRHLSKCRSKESDRACHILSGMSSANAALLVQNTLEIARNGNKRADAHQDWQKFEGLKKC